MSGTTNGVWLTNNNVFNVRERDLTAATASSVARTIEDDFDVYLEGWTASHAAASACNDADHPYFDTCVYDENYGDTGRGGLNQCAGTTSGTHPNQRCSLSYVKINTFYGAESTGIYNVCHEIAHSVGLRHTSDQASCVKQKVDGGNSRWLSPHDEAHLETSY